MRSSLGITVPPIQVKNNGSASLNCGFMTSVRSILGSYF